MNVADAGDNTDPLLAARAVLRGVKDRLPTNEFKIREATLFLSSQSVTPRAAFAVGFLGVPLGLVAVEFDVPDDIDATAGALADALLEKRTRDLAETGPPEPGPITLPAPGPVSSPKTVPNQLTRRGKNPSDVGDEPFGVQG